MRCFARKARSPGVWHPKSGGFQNAPDSIHQSRSVLHQEIASFQLDDVGVAFLFAVCDRREQFRIDTRKPGKHVSVNLIRLANAVGDHSKIARIGHDHLVAPLR